MPLKPSITGERTAFGRVGDGEQRFEIPALEIADRIAASLGVGHQSTRRNQWHGPARAGAWVATRGLERRRARLERPLDRHPLDARAELDAMAAGMIEHELRVVGLDDRGAMGKQDDVGFDLAGDREMLLAARGGVGERRAARHRPSSRPR